MKESIKEKETEQNAVSGVSKGGSGEVCGMGVEWGETLVGPLRHCE